MVYTDRFSYRDARNILKEILIFEAAEIERYNSRHLQGQNIKAKRNPS